MRISDWSSGVCSSDLVAMPAIRARGDDLQRIALISAGQRGNRLWHGGGEKERAAAIRRRVQYFFQFLTKTHVEHFVGFVENHGSQCACAKFAAFQMVAQTAWRTNDDMRPLRQLPLLIAYRSEEHKSELQSLIRSSYALFDFK